MNLGQNDMPGHLADDTRIMPIAFQARKGFVAIREQRGSSLHVGVDELFDRRGGIVGDHGEANATGTRVEIFGVFAARFGLVGVAFDHLDGAYDEDFSSIAALEGVIAFPEGDFRLIDFNHALQRLPVWIEHRAPELLRQQPSGLVGDAKLVLQLQRRHAVGMGRHEMRGPEPRRQRQSGSMHRRAGGDRSLPPTIEAFIQSRPALQRGKAAFAASRTDKTIRSASAEQEGSATRFVREGFLELGKRTGGGHRNASWRQRDCCHSRHYI